MKTMAHCEYCRKIGFFSNTSKYRICPECLNMLNINYELIYPVVQELLDLAETSVDIGSKNQHMDVAIQRMNELMNYDHNGIFNLSGQKHQIMNMRQDQNPIPIDTVQKFELEYDIKKFLF